MTTDTDAGRLSRSQQARDVMSAIGGALREGIGRGLRHLRAGESPIRVIPSSDATLERMEAEPHTVIRLSRGQAEQLAKIEAAAEQREAMRAADVAAHSLSASQARLAARA